MILSSFPDGTETVMATDGDPVAFAGGTGADSDIDDQWENLCPDSPVDRLFVVQDTQP